METSGKKREVFKKIAKLAFAAIYKKIAKVTLKEDFLKETLGFFQ